MTMTRPDLPMVPGPARLPERWPSAWPSLRSQVLLSASFPVLTAVFTAGLLLWLQLIAVAWWVPLLPLALLPLSLTRPVRVRRRVQRADEGRELRVQQTREGLQVRTPRGPLGRRVVADVFPDRSVVYRLRRG